MESRQCLCLLALLKLVIVFQLFTYTSSSSNTDNDLRILLSFKSSITKDPLSALSSWNADGNSTCHGFCGWTGVTCSSSSHWSPGGRVTALRLRGLGLIGTLSPHLGNIALCGGPRFLHLPACQSLSPDRLARHPLLHKLIISVVGGIFFLLVCIYAYYYVKKIRPNPESANRDQGNTSLSVIYQRISYAELYVATNSFSAQNLIGRGNFSTVYKGSLASGEHSSSGAVKVLDLRRQGSSACFMSECNILKRIRHRKLVKVITVCDSLDHYGDQFRALVLEFISNGSLDKWLHPTKEKSDERNLGMLSLMCRLSIALDVAEALE